MMSETKLWVTCPKPNPNAKLRLFCFSYAGGSAWVFRPWLNHLPSFIELCPLELPGRGKRWTEKPFTNLDSLVQTLGTAILPYLNRPFAFFGHSMGAMISFELTRLLSQKYEIEPVHLFVSGCRAPQLRDPNPPIYNLPEPEFIAEIRRLNGTPDAVLENAELMELVLPALRADFEMLETYKYTEASSLNCPIAVFGGLQDTEVTTEDLQAWQVQTNRAFSLQMFEGDHFFIESMRSFLLTSMIIKLSNQSFG